MIIPILWMKQWGLERLIEKLKVRQLIKGRIWTWSQGSRMSKEEKPMPPPSLSFKKHPLIPFTFTCLRGKWNNVLWLHSWKSCGVKTQRCDIPWCFHGWRLCLPSMAVTNFPTFSSLKWRFFVPDSFHWWEVQLGSVEFLLPVSQGESQGVSLVGRWGLGEESPSKFIPFIGRIQFFSVAGLRGSFPPGR